MRKRKNSRSGWQKPYQQRNALIRDLGFPDYAAYLNSEKWQEIRWKVLNRDNRICFKCKAPGAFQVHHASYCREALQGLRLDLLYTICKTCHNEAEYDGKVKAALHEVNRRLGITNHFDDRRKLRGQMADAKILSDRNIRWRRENGACESRGCPFPAQQGRFCNVHFVNQRDVRT